MASINRSVVAGGAALALVIAAIGVVLSLGGPGGTAGATQSGAEAIEGVEWTLVSLGGEKAAADREVSAEFAGGRVSGLASVNRYFASYSVSGSQISVSEIGATKMAGPEPLMEQEQSFLSALATASSFSRSGDTLTITTAAGDLVFDAK
jgi:heat shock protein HslJ